MSDNKNRVSAKAIWICFGILFLVGGIAYSSGFLITLAFIGFFAAAFSGKNSNSTAVSNNIRSGNIQSYRSATGLDGGANYSASYRTAAQGESGVDLLAEETTNNCPICKEFSSVGYCSRCGFRYKK